jgi:hypothetical protein
MLNNVLNVEDITTTLKLVIHGMEKPQDEKRGVFFLCG